MGLIRPKIRKILTKRGISFDEDVLLDREMAHFSIEGEERFIIIRMTSFCGITDLESLDRLKRAWKRSHKQAYVEAIMVAGKSSALIKVFGANWNITILTVKEFEEYIKTCIGNGFLKLEKS